MTRSQDPRAAYIAIASAMFAAQGYHGTSLAAVAGAAGVTKQALLHFFGTKERLYAEVLTDLASRLCAGIDAAQRPDPADHLTTYFRGFHQEASGQPDDMRLVVRALLDSDENARRWPLKSYLDKLLAIIALTPGGAGLNPAQQLAWCARMIGTLQYLAISGTATDGMYGPGMAGAVGTAFEDMLQAAMAELSTAL